MIRTTRRSLLAGALAVPTVAGLAHWRWRHGETSLLLHDASLAAGRRFADAGRAQGGRVLAIEGDRVRFTRMALERRPSLIAGVSRHADALMIADVAGEAGYTAVASLHGRRDQCVVGDCRPGWQALGRLADAAGGDWVEALAAYAARPGEMAARTAGSALKQRLDPGLVIGWVLAPKA